jgi:hypothetical protein
MMTSSLTLFTLPYQHTSTIIFQPYRIEEEGGMSEDVQILQHRPRVDWHELRNTRVSESILRGEGQQVLTLLILAVGERRL